MQTESGSLPNPPTSGAPECGLHSDPIRFSVASGSLAAGFRVCGLFSTEQAARAWAERELAGTYEVVPIHPIATRQVSA